MCPFQPPLPTCVVVTSAAIAPWRSVPPVASQMLPFLTAIGPFHPPLPILLMTLMSVMVRRSLCNGRTIRVLT